MTSRIIRMPYMLAGNCQITETTRRECQKCRFDLCIKAGMKAEMVMDEGQKRRRFKGATRWKGFISNQDSVKAIAPVGDLLLSAVKLAEIEEHDLPIDMTLRKQSNNPAPACELDDMFQAAVTPYQAAVQDLSSLGSQCSDSEPDSHSELTKETLQTKLTELELCWSLALESAPFSEEITDDLRQTVFGLRPMGRGACVGYLKQVARVFLAFAESNPIFLGLPAGDRKILTSSNVGSFVVSVLLLAYRATCPSEQLRWLLLNKEHPVTNENQPMERRTRDQHPSLLELLTGMEGTSRDFLDGVIQHQFSAGLGNFHVLAHVCLLRLGSSCVVELTDPEMVFSQGIMAPELQCLEKFVMALHFQGQSP